MVHYIAHGTAIVFYFFLVLRLVNKQEVKDEIM